MIGGPPVAQPYYPYQYPVQPQAYVQQPRPQSARPAAPVVRAQMSDDAPRRPAPPPKLEMPSPEALGVPVPIAPPDWTDLRVRLDRIGATKFALEKQADGYYFTCQVRTSDGRLQTVEGRATTEAEAVQRALASAVR